MSVVLLRKGPGATVDRFAPSRFGGITSNYAFRESTILDDLSVVNDVVLLRAGPGNLGDRHYYTEQALQDAVARSIFEGVQCYLNHPTTIEERTIPERSVEKLAGWFSDVTCRPYTDPEFGKTVALYGNFHPRVGDDRVISIIRTCLEYAKRYPRMAWAGLSINAMGDSVPGTIDGEQWNQVDRIDAAESVDIVTRAGAGGTLTPFKESYRMKTGTTKKKTTTPAEPKLTLDTDAVREGLKKILAGVKTSFKEALGKAKIENGAVSLSDDQDKELDRALGIVDGGALDKVLDDATGVQDEDEAGAVVPGNEGAVVPGMGEGDAEVEAMPDDPKFLKAQLKKERGARKEAESKATDAEERATESDRKAGLVSRERMAENVLASLEIPEDFRPRLKQELVERGYTHEKSMREHAQAFDKAFIRPHIDGNGVVSASGGSKPTGGGGFNFD